MSYNKNYTLAFVLPNLNTGGAQRVVTTLANELCLTYDVIIITLSGGDSNYKLSKSIKHIECTTKSIESKQIFQAIKNNFVLTKKLAILFEDHMIDLAIGFTTSANILSIYASKKVNIPCIVSERSNPNIYIPNKFWHFLRKLSYKKASYVVVQTKLIQSYFKNYTSKDKLIILPNPLAGEFIMKKNTTAIKKKIILNVGRLDKNKSQDLLIRAFSNIDNTNWQLMFIGDGAEKQNYIDLAKNLGIASKVTFLGNCSNIHEYYNTSKIFAFTSKSEGFPNVLIEAMFFELPCISTNCPTGPSEIITDNLNGFLIPVNDQAALENKLELLIFSEELQQKLGENAVKSIQKFKTEHVVKKWEEIIEKSIP